MTQQRHLRDWEDLAETDPLWAILSNPDKRGGRWDIDEFLATGAADFDRVMARAEEYGLPEGRARSLDFGCGVGRVTRAMGSHFESSVGVDISERMVRSAEELDRDFPNVSFIQHERDDLALFDGESFDLIYSCLVLQHLPSVEMIGHYVSEFGRLLAPGGLLMFQVPHHIPYRRRVQPRRRAYAGLRRLGVPPRTLSGRLRLSPIRMTHMEESRVRASLRSSDARVLGVTRTTDPRVGITDAEYWVTKDRPSGNQRASRPAAAS